MRSTLMINFEKWDGNGNDFVIVNSIDSKIKLKKSFIKKISDRNKGIGFDQLIHVGLPTKDKSDFFIRFYNADGNEAGMCLNGVRCASSYIWNNQFAPKKRLNIQTKYNNIKCDHNNDDVIVGIDKPKKIDNKKLLKKLKKIIKDDFFLLNTGNNHLCIEMPFIEKVNLKKIYEDLYSLIKDDDFNLSIFDKKSENIKIRTYENGVGETLSCGSASLCVASNILRKKNKVKVISLGGCLSFKVYKDSILMSGPTNFSYKGNVNE